MTALTYFSNYNASSPTCSIAPSDCDPLWQAYSISSSAWKSGAKGSGTVGAGSAQITAPPQTPPCLNQSAAISWAAATSSLYGCGLCTIYGEGVELVYFPEPTTVSRDMCASTPLASQTYYGDGAVIEAYAGTAYGRNGSRSGGKTAIVGHNTFTSGTAYISIATVFAQDRCSSTRGSPVYNAILAMPSESVLSLRYSQDHFQWAAVTATQTGYPVSYADFNHPVPWSAWNGQAQCDPGAQGGYFCDVVYEDGYRPQLAIPPEINLLNPQWSDCQLWYGGLYDPPLALQSAQSIAQPTVPGQLQQTTSAAAPSSTAAAPTVAATALPEVNGASQSATQQQSAQSSPSVAQPSMPGVGGTSSSTVQQQNIPSGQSPAESSPVGSGAGTSKAWTTAVTANGQTLIASACGSHACIGTVTISASQTAQTLPNGIVASYVLGGIGIQGSSTIVVPVTTPSNGLPGPSRPGQVSVVVQTVVTIGAQVVTVQQAGSDGVVVAGSATLAPGGAATTLQNGHVLSAGAGGLVVGWSSEVQAGAQATDIENNNPAATPTHVVVSAVSAGVIIDGSIIPIPIATALGQSSATIVVINGFTHTISSPASGVAVVDGGVTLTASGAAATLTQIAGTGIAADSPALTIANSAYSFTPLGTTGCVIDGQTVSNGGQVTVGGQVVSLQSNGNGVVVVGGSATQTLEGTRITGSPSLIVGSLSYAVTPLGTIGYVINGQTVPNGGQVTVGGQVVSLQANGNGVVVVGGTATQTLIATSITGTPSLIIGSSGYAVTPLGTTGYVIDGQTLSNGDQVIVGGHTVSLQNNGNGVVVVDGTSTQTLVGTSMAGSPSLTIGGSAFGVTPIGTTGYVIDGQTVSNGGQVTVNGQVVSLESSGGVVVIGGTTTETIPLASGSVASTGASSSSGSGIRTSGTASVASQTSTTASSGVSGRSAQLSGSSSVHWIAFMTILMISAICL